MSDIFISYANEDLERIRPLVRALESNGWSLFWDRTIPAGKTWRQFIGTEIERCRCMIVVWSTHSLESDWVQEEADEGKSKNLLVPVLIDDVLPPLGFRSVQAAKLIGWDGNQSSTAFEKLLKDISGVLGEPPVPGDALQKHTRTEIPEIADEQSGVVWTLRKRLLLTSITIVGILFIMFIVDILTGQSKEISGPEIPPVVPDKVITEQTPFPESGPLVDCNLFPTTNTVDGLMSWSNYYHKQIPAADGIKGRAWDPCNKAIDYRGMAHCKAPNDPQIRLSLLETLTLCRVAGIEWKDIKQ